MLITIQTFAPNVYLLVLLAVLDRLVLSPIIRKRLGTKAARRDVSATRWFFLHALANAFVCVTAINTLLTTFSDPYNAMDSRVYSDVSMLGAASIWPLAMVNSVHIYHMLGGFMLTSADYFHHLLFVPLLGFPGQVLPWGPVEPAGELSMVKVPP